MVYYLVILPFLCHATPQQRFTQGFLGTIWSKGTGGCANRMLCDVSEFAVTVNSDSSFILLFEDLINCSQSSWCRKQIMLTLWNPATTFTSPALILWLYCLTVCFSLPGVMLQFLVNLISYCGKSHVKVLLWTSCWFDVFFYCNMVLCVNLW